jgi:hypothetical protein
MNIRASLHTAYSTPNAAFINTKDFILAEPGAFHDSDTPAATDRVNKPSSQGNENTKLRWRVDGCTAAGTQFFVIPLLSHLPTPLRLDAVLSDSSKISAGLHQSLELSSLCYKTSTVEMSHPFLDKLTEALTRFSLAEELSYEKLEKLPFGSEFQIDGDSLGPGGMHIELWPNYDLERKMLSLESLKILWASCVPEEHYPPVLDITNLQLIQQVQDSITIVQVRNMSSLGPLVFKSSTRGCHYLYHELKTLLSIPRHDNIMGFPQFIIVKKCCFGGKVFVCGFILPFYPMGSLRANLPHVRDSGSETALELGIQICTALVHLTESGIYCSDLRPDNILLSNDGSSLKAILIDFEQRGNWFTWSAPEIYNLEYLQLLAMSDLVPDEYKSYCLKTLEDMGCDRALRTQESEYCHFEGGCNTAWNALSPEEQESATVFLVGKLLWCLFEGVGTVSQFDLLWREGQEAGDITEFPTFVRTPESIRELILACTSVASEHRGRPSAVIRQGDKVLRRGHSDSGMTETECAREVVEASISWWRDELARMELFFRRPHRFAVTDQSKESEEQYSQFKAPERPKLKHILRQLESLRFVLG